MTSTMGALCQQLKQKPTEIKIFNKILEQFLSKKVPIQTKLDDAPLVMELLKNYFGKISANKQQATYSYLQTVSLKFASILLKLSGQDSQKGLELLTQYVHLSTQKEEILNCIAEEITLPQSSIQWSFLKQCSIIKLICNTLVAKLQQQHLDPHPLIKFVFQLEHMNNLTPDNVAVLPGEDPSRQFKHAYQKLTIECLSRLQSIDDEEQVKIYHRLGDRIFSKFSSPLILAQFLLNKFTREQQNTAVQIQILSCLFILVGKYGLEMEQFYSNLEKMISQKRGVKNSLFRLKNSKRFLKLVESAMRSSKVPFKNILSLTQLIIRHSFKEESEFSFWALSFLVNLVKKHRQLQNHLAEMPEVELMKQHYSARIRSLVGQLSKNLNKSQYLDIEQFGKVNCQKLCQQKLVQIEEKMQQNEEQIEFKMPNMGSYFL